MSTLSIPALSTNNYFQDTTRYIYGLDISAGTPTQATITAANKLWNEFLTTQGLTQDTFKQAIGYNESTHTASNTVAVQKYTTLYNDFVTKQLSYLYESQATNLSILNEQESRDIIFKTFSLVLQMLSVLQKSMQESSDALVFYTKLQQQYTEMLKHIPLLSFKPSHSYQLDIQDFGKTTIGGYGDINIGNIVDFLVNKISKASNNFTQTSQVTFTVWFSMSYDNTTKQLTFASPGVTTASFNTSGMSAWTVMQKASTGLLQEATKNLQYVVTNGRAHLPAWDDPTDFPWIVWPESTLPSTKPDVADSTHPITKFDEDKQRQQQRAEVNAKLQLYISNAQANRDLAQSQSKPMENLVNQTREAIQAQMTLIDNMVSLLKGLLGAVTRS